MRAYDCRQERCSSSVAGVLLALLVAALWVAHHFNLIGPPPGPTAGRDAQHAYIHGAAVALTTLLALACLLYTISTAISALRALPSSSPARTALLATTTSIGGKQRESPAPTPAPDAERGHALPSNGNGVLLPPSMRSSPVSVSPHARLFTTTLLLVLALCAVGGSVSWLRWSLRFLRKNADHSTVERKALAAFMLGLRSVWAVGGAVVLCVGLRKVLRGKQQRDIVCPSPVRTKGHVWPTLN